ncbi:MAG TPA: tetratricopeptide repeat protein [Syntrophorhabdaceae bacterium]|nr:tetratricopeptide repeat protein [Syntrophorhabdaceae bacterium]OQC52653.1 MAG: photosystem I assembly protein Ycf3 [Deltaproteobacteria bacterium ADurb.Bin026]MBP8699544.1 tetratricopeptide repeat protein [Syntrophorhabdaceae bacterium]HOF56793.1 tetratricopeptide repeat protein [Syntrophorhabdaceae bacterium]HOS04602.1 tetratricopeptide repeat protein [Syntrophorhabdaceae bacterium]
MLKRCSIFIVIFFLICVFPSMSFCETPFEKGMAQFNEENYEEALELFAEAIKLEPASSSVAFYYGLTYKLMEKYKEAIPYLRDAVTLTPHIREALPELIDSLYQENDLKEAIKWVEVGEKENIASARIQYFKGLILTKENKNQEAVEAFKKAKELDATLAQAVEFQIASIYLKEGRLRDSQERFKAAISLDPRSDIGAYARDYENLVSDKMEREKTFRFNVSLSYKHDTNVNAAPTSGPFVDIPALSSQISGQRDFALNSTIRIQYMAPFSFKTPYSLSMQYALYAERYFRRDDYNTMQQSFLLNPGYNFQRVSLTLPMMFAYTWLQGDNRDGFGSGSDFLNSRHWYKDAQYMKMLSANPTARFLVAPNHIAELTFGISRKRYDIISSDAPPASSDENRDALNTSGTIGWMYLFKEGEGLLSFRYTYANEDAEGWNWSYNENRFSLSLIYPILKSLKFQITSDASFTNYRHENSIYGMQRKDDTYINSALLTYEFRPKTYLTGQYTYTRDKSNIGSYDYKREIFSLGIEYRF